MSAQNQTTRRLTIRDVSALKGQRPIVSLTAYTAPFAAILDPHVDILLVGDSLGMVLYGMDSTLPVSLDDMIRHAQAVMRATQLACVVVDMPFGSYQLSPEQAFENAARIMKETGASIVKIEGGAEMADTIRFLSERAIPVMAHIGLKPQHVHVMGGYRYQGRTTEECTEILADAKAVEQAGACALLLEGMDATLATQITKDAIVPTIGIGAGQACDGQILVTEDMLGLSKRTPKFVKEFGGLREHIGKAVQAYAQEVRDGIFPDKAHSYGVKS